MGLYWGYWGYIRAILGLYWGSIGAVLVVILGLYRGGNGKENGRYFTI